MNGLYLNLWESSFLCQPGFFCYSVCACFIHWLIQPPIFLIYTLMLKYSYICNFRVRNPWFLSLLLFLLDVVKIKLVEFCTFYWLNMTFFEISPPLIMISLSFMRFPSFNSTIRADVKSFKCGTNIVFSGILYNNNCLKNLSL